MDRDKNNDRQDVPVHNWYRRSKKKVKNIFTRIEIKNPRQNPAIKMKYIAIERTMKVIWKNNNNVLEQNITTIKYILK